MLCEELDFLLMQYLDGSLPSERRAAVRNILDSHPEARTRLRSYQRLDDVFRSKGPMPSIHWEELAKRISAAVTLQRS
jgi:anti-sigma factor RsiW